MYIQGFGCSRVPSFNQLAPVDLSGCRNITRRSKPLEALVHCFHAGPSISALLALSKLCSWARIKSRLLCVDPSDLHEVISLRASSWTPFAHRPHHCIYPGDPCATLRPLRQRGDGNTANVLRFEDICGSTNRGTSNSPQATPNGRFVSLQLTIQWINIIYVSYVVFYVKYQTPWRNHGDAIDFGRFFQANMRTAHTVEEGGTNFNEFPCEVAFLPFTCREETNMHGGILKATQRWLPRPTWPFARDFKSRATSLNPTSLPDLLGGRIFVHWIETAFYDDWPEGLDPDISICLEEAYMRILEDIPAWTRRLAMKELTNLWLHLPPDEPVFDASSTSSTSTC